MTTSDRIWQRLMRGVEYIERNIEQELTVAKVASKAALSEFHFHRLFRARFGLPVFDYVRRRRITRAASALLHSRQPIIQIALDAGFESQAAFSRAFRRVYHVSPALFRGRGRDVPWLSSAPINTSVLTMFPGLGKTQPRLETIEPFAVAGLQAHFDGAGRERIPQLWSELLGITGRACLADGDCVGISENDDAVLGGMLGYMAAIAISPSQLHIDGLTRRTLSGGCYLVFTFSGAFQDLSTAHDYIFGIWMPGSRHALAPMPSFYRIALRDIRAGTASVQIWIPVLAS